MDRVDVVLDSAFRVELFIADQTSVLSCLEFTLRTQETGSITTLSVKI